MLAYSLTLLCGKSHEESKTVRLARHTGFCTTSDVTLAEIRDDMFCLVAPEHVVDKALNRDRELKLELRIDKCKNMAHS